MRNKVEDIWSIIVAVFLALIILLGGIYGINVARKGKTGSVCCYDYELPIHNTMPT